MKSSRKNVQVDVDSALAVMQEVYNDIAEQKNNASMIMRKMLVFLKTPEDMLTIGQVIKEQQKILNDLTEKKISLVKLHASMIKISKTSNGNSTPTGKFELTEEDDEFLNSLIEKEKLKLNPNNEDNNFII